MEAIDAYTPAASNMAAVEPNQAADAVAAEQQAAAHNSEPQAEPVADPQVGQVVDEYV